MLKSWDTNTKKNYCCFVFQYWDYKGGYELDTQYKTGTACFVLATALSFLFAGYAYM